MSQLRLVAALLALALLAGPAPAAAQVDAQHSQDAIDAARLGQELVQPPTVTQAPGDASPAPPTITGGALRDIRDDHYSQYDKARREEVHAPGTVASPQTVEQAQPVAQQPVAQQQVQAQAQPHEGEPQAPGAALTLQPDAHAEEAAHAAHQFEFLHRQLHEAPEHGHGAPQAAIPLATVAVLTVVMAAAAGLGALPFFFVRTLSKRWTGLATAVACGVMFAASFDLVHEGQPYGRNLVVLGVVLGGVFISATHSWLEQYEDIQFGELRGGSARKTVLMVGIMAAHALGEGCGVGVSFVGDRGWTQGVLTTLAIGVHNVPEGMAKAAVLVGQGTSAGTALFWSVLTCLPQPLVAVPSFVFVDAFRAILPVALGFAAGCMVWMVFAELLPDALEAAPKPEVASAATLAAAALEWVRMGFESLETGDGRIAVPVAGDLDLIWPALVVVVPAVAAAMFAGGLLGSFGMAPAVGFGLAAAVAGWTGTALVAHQALHSSAVPLAHTLCAAVLGATGVLLFRRSLLLSAAAHPVNGSSGGKVKHGGSNGGSVDLEAAPARAAQAGGGYATVNGSIPFGGGGGGGYGSSEVVVGPEADMYSAAYMRRTPFDVSAQPTSPSKARGSPRARLAAQLPSPQRAARGALVAALVAYAVPQGWRLAEGLLLLGGHVPSMMLPAALMLGMLGIAASAAMGRSFGSGMWAGALPSLVAAGAAVHAVLQAPPGISYDDARRRFGYPMGLAPTAEALAGGALCMAALLALAAATLLHPRRARGGFVLGILLAAGVHLLQRALCMLTEHCLEDTVAD